jgi:lipoprotein-releasing system permease protein
MTFEFFLAAKHLLKGRRRGFVSLITGISVLGVGVGVMALIVVLAVMSGFDRELKRKIVGVQPHIRVEQIGGVANQNKAVETIRSLNDERIETIAPYVEGQAIIRSDQNALGVMIKAIDSEREPLHLIEKHLEAGTLLFDDIEVSTEPEEEEWMGRAVIGAELAKRLKKNL